MEVLPSFLKELKEKALKSKGMIPKKTLNTLAQEKGFKSWAAVKKIYVDDGMFDFECFISSYATEIALQTECNLTFQVGKKRELRTFNVKEIVETDKDVNYNITLEKMKQTEQQLMPFYKLYLDQKDFFDTLNINLNDYGSYIAHARNNYRGEHSVKDLINRLPMGLTYNLNTLVRDAGKDKYTIKDFGITAIQVHNYMPFGFFTNKELPIFNDECDVRDKLLHKQMHKFKIHSPYHSYEDYIVEQVTKDKKFNKEGWYLGSKTIMGVIMNENNENLSFRDIGEEGTQLEHFIGANLDDVLNKITEEVGELNKAIQRYRGRYCRGKGPIEEVEKELGDVLFLLSTAITRLGLDPNNFAKYAEATLIKFRGRKDNYI